MSQIHFSVPQPFMNCSSTISSYACIFSNKFDLIQAIHVSHTVLTRQICNKVKIIKETVESKYRSFITGIEIQKRRYYASK